MLQKNVLNIEHAGKDKITIYSNHSQTLMHFTVPELLSSNKPREDDILNSLQ